MRTTQRDRGAVMPIVALLLPVLILMTAFAVDLGRQRSSRRTMQARADVIALDLVRLADGRTEDQIVADPGYAAYVAGSAARNEVPVTALTVEWGTWTAASGFVGTLGNAVPDAVEVTAAETIDYFFQPGTGSTTRTAVATQTRKAGFKIGSFAAAINTDASTKAMLNRILDDALNVSVLSYEGLADVSLDYRRVAVQLGLVNPEDLFSSGVTARQFIAATATILEQGDPASAEATVLRRSIDPIPASPAPLETVTVENVVTVDPQSQTSALDATFNVLDFLAGAAFIANGTAGLGLPTVDLGLPGYQIANGSLTLIQSPAEAYGPVGTPASTSQASTLATSSAGTVALGDFLMSEVNQVLPGACGLLLLGAVACGLTLRSIDARLTSVVDLDLAAATGTISDIRCPSADELDIDISSGLLTASIGIQVELFAGGTSLGTVPLSVLNQRPASNGTADFVIPPDAYDVFKPASPGVGSLTGNTTISGIDALGVLNRPVLTNALNTTVTRINERLVNPVAGIAGARFASADVAPKYRVDCRSVILVG